MLPKYRMLALDLDGTLFDSMGNVPRANLDAVRRAQDAGMLVALCTGRGLCESRPAIDALEHEGPLILAGGSLVSDPSTGRTLHAALIEPALATQLVKQLQREGLPVLALLDPDPFTCDYVVVGREDDIGDNTRWWFEMIGAQIKYVDHAAAQDLHKTLRVGIVGPPRIMPAIEQSLLARFGDRIVVQHFMAVKQPGGEDIHVLEVFAQGVTKWSGIQWVAAQHGIELHQVAAIGDHVNDLAMIEAAGCGIAMGNAVDVIRQAARCTTLSNDEAGVAMAIDRLLSGEW